MRQRNPYLVDIAAIVVLILTRPRPLDATALPDHTPDVARGEVLYNVFSSSGAGCGCTNSALENIIDRKFERMALGGLHDEAELRGHRRTYIGAMPGKFVQALKEVGVANPVIMLDEIDKIGASYQGDPALFNPYGIIAVNPKRYPDINSAGAQALIDWITSPAGQKLIGSYMVAGSPLFTPSADTGHIAQENAPSGAAH